MKLRTCEHRRVAISELRKFACSQLRNIRTPQLARFRCSEHATFATCDLHRFASCEVPILRASQLRKLRSSQVQTQTGQGTPLVQNYAEGSPLGLLKCKLASSVNYAAMLILKHVKSSSKYFSRERRTSRAFASVSPLPAGRLRRTS